jgi:multidrug efflux pump subunit AcrB
MIGRLIYKHSFSIVALLVLAATCAVLLLPRLKTDTSFRQFMPGGEPAYQQYHGLLISIIIVSALVTDLLLTPVLMASFFREKKKPLSAVRIRLFRFKTKKA